MVLKKMTYLLLLLGLIASSGCSTKKIILHPIDKMDIYAIPQDASIMIPAGASLRDDAEKIIKTWGDTETINNTRSGYFLSNLYINEVMEAKIKK